MTKPCMELRLPLDVHPLEAIKKAAYRMSGRAVFDLSVEDNVAIIIASQINEIANETLQEIVDRFKVEVLDADLRMIIADETEGVRNIILSHVFSKTGLTENG